MEMIRCPLWTGGTPLEAHIGGWKKAPDVCFNFHDRDLVSMTPRRDCLKHTSSKPRRKHASCCCCTVLYEYKHTRVAQGPCITGIVTRKKEGGEGQRLHVSPSPFRPLGESEKLQHVISVRRGSGMPIQCFLFFLLLFLCMRVTRPAYHGSCCSYLCGVVKGWVGEKTTEVVSASTSMSNWDPRRVQTFRVIADPGLVCRRNNSLSMVVVVLVVLVVALRTCVCGECMYVYLCIRGHM